MLAPEGVKPGSSVPAVLFCHGFSQPPTNYLSTLRLFAEQVGRGAEGRRAVLRPPIALRAGRYFEQGTALRVLCCPVSPAQKFGAACPPLTPPSPGNKSPAGLAGDCPQHQHPGHCLQLSGDNRRLAGQAARQAAGAQQGHLGQRL